MELLMSDVFGIVPQLEETKDAVHAHVVYVRNHKEALKMLLDQQLAVHPNDEPLTYVMSNNTRKWSGAFIEIGRVVKLKDYGKVVVRNIADCPAVPYQGLGFVQGVLFEFFFCEQVTQMDASNLLHYGFCWFRLKAHLTDFAATLHALGRIDQYTRIMDALQHRQEMFEINGVLHLSYLSWPSLPRAEREKYHRRANRELRALVEKQWAFWQEHKTIGGLPSPYHCTGKTDDDTAESLQKMEEFLADALAQFSEHLNPQTPEVRRPQELFAARSAEYEAALRTAGAVVKPDLKSMTKVSSYHAQIAAEVPAYSYVVVSVLSKVIANEAPAERYFSSEAYFHNKVNNRQENVVTESRMRIRWDGDRAKKIDLLGVE
jgi:hypothetical protein